MAWKGKTAVLMAVLMLLCSCGGGRADRLAWARVQGKLAGEWELQAQVLWAGEPLSLTLQRSPAERLVLAFEAPESLAGLRAVFLPGETQLCYQDLTDSFPSGRLPEGSVAGQLADALKRVLALEPSQLELERREGLLWARADGLELTAGLESGNIMTLSIPEQGMELKALDFRSLP